MSDKLLEKISEFHSKIYLDNNASTFMSDDTIQYMIKFCNLGNPSAEHIGGKLATNLIKRFKEVIAETYNFSLDKSNPESYSIIINSGASESNSFIVNSVARAYIANTKLKPHIIISNVEHKSMTVACKALLSENLIELSYAEVDTDGEYYGAVNPSTLVKLIRQNTCLISIMTANNETGIINRIPLLAKLARDRSIPFHTDAVQYVGKHILYPSQMDITAFSLSFHKLHGPPGIGILAIKNTLIEGYQLCAQICGSQNSGLRGGTENIPSIAASMNAFIETSQNRKKKTEMLLEMKNDFIRELKKKASDHNISLRNIHDYKPLDKRNAVIYIITPVHPYNEFVLENTILLTIDKPNFCNIEFKRRLDSHGVVVAVGSACNTSDSLSKLGTPSDVVKALSLPKTVEGNAIRISLSDMNNTKQIKLAAKIFANVLIHY